MQLVNNVLFLAFASISPCYLVPRSQLLYLRQIGSILHRFCQFPASDNCQNLFLIIRLMCILSHLCLFSQFQFIQYVFFVHIIQAVLKSDSLFLVSLLSRFLGFLVTCQTCPCFWTMFSNLFCLVLVSCLFYIPILIQQSVFLSLCQSVLVFIPLFSSSCLLFSVSCTCFYGIIFSVQISGILYQSFFIVCIWWNLSVFCSVVNIKV